MSLMVRFKATRAGVCSTKELLFLGKTQGEGVPRNSRQRAILRDLDYLTPINQCGARPESMARVYRGTSNDRREGYRGRREKFGEDSHGELRPQCRSERCFDTSRVSPSFLEQMVQEMAQRAVNMESLLQQVFLDRLAEEILTENFDHSADWLRKR